MTPGVDHPASKALRDALTRRLVDARAAAKRMEGFAFEPGQDAPGLLDEEESQTDSMRDLVLKALNRTSDPLNFSMLRHLNGGDASIAALAKLTGLTRIATSERVSDLVQVGLVGRSHQGDAVGLSPAGTALVELIESASRDEDGR